MMEGSAVVAIVVTLIALGVFGMWIDAQWFAVKQTTKEEAQRTRKLIIAITIKILHTMGLTLEEALAKLQEVDANLTETGTALVDIHDAQAEALQEIIDALDGIDQLPQDVSDVLDGVANKADAIKQSVLTAKGVAQQLANLIS